MQMAMMLRCGHGGGGVGVSSFPSSSSSSSYYTHNSKPTSLSSSIHMLVTRRRNIACFAVQESSIKTGMLHCSCTRLTSLSYNLLLGLVPKRMGFYFQYYLLVAADTKEAEAKAKEAEAKAKTAPKAAPAKPKAPAKAPAKPLPQMMEEDVIPSLRSILEAQQDISELELSFQDNRLEGSFLKKGNPYSFWAFFPNGVLTGPKGFSLSSYGSGASTVEPFLIDEKKITAKHVVFWVEKRLAAQGIIPVWKD
ncbi:hypothetical protein FEM48_Zijuj04G0201300 [Ziziphus jujuba var. spinosa]|uniref:Uncharacterized protein n=1 Tax=Ziziphus jujuba var. spinosa TaxID=714518 RepID=A0A978VLY0_ZIZJJ|nr:hypothetical protein FEM48_Zijuj04G0201300 [Ziziphus jujuba var. spinosa]